MIDAVIMAGGRSERMRASAGAAHKALVPVLGVPLIERNLCTLLGAGFRGIAVVANACETELRDYVAGRGRAIASHHAATLDYVVETKPLGTIGIAGTFEQAGDALLIVNVDNLTSLDLQKFVAHQRACGAAMTIAAHEECFQIPFGELLVEAGAVTGYLEKPQKPVHISSGTYVLGVAARQMIPAGERMDIPRLVAKLLDDGLKVAAFEHDAAWIDVNDRNAVDRAERLIAKRSAEFELWSPAPDEEIVELVLHSPVGILLERGNGDLWLLPSEPVGEDRDAAAACCSQRFRTFHPQDLRFVAAYDAFDELRWHVTRRHVFAADCDATHVLPSARRRWWMPAKNTWSDSTIDSSVARSLTLETICDDSTRADSLRLAQAALRRA